MSNFFESEGLDHLVTIPSCFFFGSGSDLLLPVLAERTQAAALAAQSRAGTGGQKRVAGTDRNRLVLLGSQPNVTLTPKTYRAHFSKKQKSIVPPNQGIS